MVPAIMAFVVMLLFLVFFRDPSAKVGKSG
jgi:hypothetical protein